MLTVKEIRRIGKKKHHIREGLQSPSPEEIRAGCLAVQATWSDVERRRRDMRAGLSAGVETRLVRYTGSEPIVGGAE